MNFSIRRLINILVIVSSLSLLTLGMSAIISNFMMNRNQEGLIKAIMIENLSGNISQLVVSDLIRQESFSNRERNSAAIIFNKNLMTDGAFYAIEEQLIRLSIGYPELNIAALRLKKEYDSLMRSEQAMIRNINDTISLRNRLKKRLSVIERNAPIIRKKTDSISGKLMLRQARRVRALRKNTLTKSLTTKQIQKEIKVLNSAKNLKLQRLSNDIKGDFLKFLALTHRLRNEQNMDQLNNLRFNQLIQPMNKVHEDLKKMLTFLEESDPLYQEVLDMSGFFLTLSNQVLYNHDSIYELRKALNKNEGALVETRKLLFESVNNINGQLLTLKNVVTNMGEKIIPASKRLSLIILVSISILALIFLMMFIFLGRTILKVITSSLNKLVDAMMNISSGKSLLNKRVDVPPQKELAKLSNSFNEMITQLNQGQVYRDKLNKAYQKFVPEKGLELLGRKSIIDIRLGDFVECSMSVLFSDIRDFTSITERMSASESFDFINEYLKVMEPIIEKYNGFIDKYIGDAIMALFPEKLGADDAVNAGIEMMNALYGFNASRQARGLVAINIGVGINTGELILGTIGGNIRMEETVIGDTVNVASRMESLNKQFGTHILISGSTFHKLSKKIELQVRSIGYTAIKGKAKKVAAYEIYNHCQHDLIKQKSDISGKLLEACCLIEKGKIKQARIIFLECKELAPMDLVVDYYLQLVADNSRRESDK